MTNTNNDDDDVHSSKDENKNAELFTNKLGKIKAHYADFDLLLKTCPEAQADIDAYLRRDHDHEYWKDPKWIEGGKWIEGSECNEGTKWIEGTNNFQYERLLQKDEIFACNKDALIVGNVYSFDVQQNPQKAGMSFIHLLGIPTAQIFNGVSLTPDNCDIIDDIINLFESEWLKFRSNAIDYECNKITQNKEKQIEIIENACQNQEKVREVKRTAGEAVGRWIELESQARKLEVADFSYGLHLWPEQSVPHLHIHIIAHPSSMRRYSTDAHDGKTVDAREVRDFLKSSRKPNNGSETPVHNGGETNNITTNGGQDQPEPNETSTESIVRNMSGLGISDTKA